MSNPRDDFAGSARFSVDRCLGHGGFGTVYQVYDKQRRARVALKVLRGTDAGALFRLKQEFRALADLSHPNLVSLYELLSDDERWCISMELVAGRPFPEFIWGEALREYEQAAEVFADDIETGTDPTAIEARRKGPALQSSSFARLEESLGQLAYGLRYLHSAGKLHRDIKPSNVLVTGDGRVVLLDFGLVTELGVDPSDSGGDIAGTPPYMAPEQASARFSEAGDWYSVGVMVFQVLTGTLPFTGSLMEMMTAKRARDAPDVSTLVPSIPPHLNDLCRDLLSRDPVRRLGGADSLLRFGSRRLPKLARPVVSTSVPFVGRAEQLEALKAAYDASKAGQAVTIYVHGNSGIGKSALVRRFLEAVHEWDPQTIILPGRCFERESVPYKALDSLVDALSGYLRKLPRASADAFLPRDVLALARLFPTLRRVEAIANARQRAFEIPDSQELRRRAFAAFRDLMARLGEKHSIVLFIDDLQWGDADSAALLTELLRPPDQPALLLIGAYRTAEATSSVALQMLLPKGGFASNGHGQVRELPISELKPEDARRLAAAIMSESEPAGWSADALAQEAGGNPYFIDQLARYAGGRADVSLDDVISVRVRQLPEAARRMLELLAVFGQPLDLSIASLAAGISSKELEALAVLRSEHLSRVRVIEGREEIETYHDRIRQTIVAHIEPGVLRAHHQDLAKALKTQPSADPETLAIHLQGAGENQEAAGYALAAADRAANALAFDHAARLYRLVLDLDGNEPTSRRRILGRLGDALANAGRGRDAAQAYLSAVEGASPVDRLLLQRQAAEQLLRSGHIEEGFDAIRAVLATMGMKLASSPRRALLSMLLRRIQIRLRGLGFHERDVSQISPEELVRIDACWSIAIGLAIVDNIRAADFQSRHLLWALRTGEPYRIARALALEVGYSSIPGGRRAERRARDVFDVAERLAQRVGNPHGIGLVGVSKGTADHLLGHWKASNEACQRSEEILRERCTGTAWELSIAHLYGLRSLYFLGEIGEIARRLPTLLKEARERDDLNAVTNLQTGVSYLTWLAADAPDKARAEVREGISQWYQKGFTAQHYFELLSSAEIALYSGDGLGAWTHVDRQWRPLERSLVQRIELVFTESLSVRVRSAAAAASATSDAADRASLLRIATRELQRLRRRRIPAAQPLADLVEAGISLISGQGDAARLLKRAIERFGALDMALHVAAARRRLGELTAGDSGQQLIDAADAWMYSHGIRNPERMALMLAPKPL